MDKLILFLLVLLIIVNLVLALSLNKTEGFKDLNLTDEDKAIPLWRVITYLDKIGLPREINMEFASTIKAKDPKQQADLDRFLQLMKKSKLVINENNLEKIEKAYQIPLDDIGLVNSLNFLRAHVHAYKIYDAYNNFNYLVLNKMREKNNVIY